jgi:hypothetical protein
LSDWRRTVEEEAVIATYTAIFEATGLLTEEVLRWNSGKAGARAPKDER